MTVMFGRRPCLPSSPPLNSFFTSAFFLSDVAKRDGHAVGPGLSQNAKGARLMFPFGFYFVSSRVSMSVPVTNLRERGFNGHPSLYSIPRLTGNAPVRFVFFVFLCLVAAGGGRHDPHPEPHSSLQGRVRVLGEQKVRAQLILRSIKKEVTNLEVALI